MEGSELGCIDGDEDGGVVGANDEGNGDGVPEVYVGGSLGLDDGESDGS